MEEILYNSLNTYFKIISSHGYRSYSIVYKILVIDFLNDFIKEFNELLSVEDRHLIQSLLYCFFETTCGIEHFSNIFTITAKPLSTPKYMYTGVGAIKPTVSEILAGAKYDFNQVHQFTTPAMTLRTIWIALPTDITLVSMKNVNFAGDYLYNLDTGKDVLTKEDLTLEGESYRLYYLTTIKTNNPYIVKVREG